MEYVSRELRSLLLQFFNMLKISSVSAEDKLNPIYRSVEKSRIQRNFLNIIPSSLALLLIEICGIIYNVFISKSLKYQIIYISSFVAFFIITLIILKYINSVLSTDKISDKKKVAICYTYWFIYLLSAMSFSVFEALDSGTVIHYFIFIVALTFWPVLEPALMVPYYCAAMATETVMLYLTDAHYLTYLFCFIITAFGIISSYVKYSTYMSRHMDSERLQRMAEVDPLTGLMNRRGMQHSVEGIWNYCKSNKIPIAMAMLDVDFFKMYNDKYGHSQGDDCLKRISACIRDHFSRRTDITCRFGGEEFIIILAGIDEQKALMSFVNLQSSVEKLEIPSGNSDFNKNVTVSMGVFSTVIDDSTDFKHMVMSVDSELYNAKEHGRNCLSFRGELYNQS